MPAVTTEFENVRPTACRAWPQRVFVAPNAHGVSVAQDRIAEKRFFVDCAGKSGVLPAPHKVIATQADIDAIGDDCCPAS
jgi:5-(carboxyamino)imidazole ribonucleotide synthase